MLKLVSGSGHAAAVAVLDLLKSWQCDAFVIGMCFKTTASKTGRVYVCTLLETAIGHNLLKVACRHHLSEVLLSDAFVLCIGKVCPSTVPDILLFKPFKNNASLSCR